MINKTFRIMSTTTTTAARRVVSGYRRLFRARKKLFQGDARALEESRLAIREQFYSQQHQQQQPATLSSDHHHQHQHFEGLMTMIDEAEHMMLHGIVQGKLNDDTGNYGECIYIISGNCTRYCSVGVIR